VDVFGFVPHSRFSPESETGERGQLCEAGQLRRCSEAGRRRELHVGKICRALRSANPLKIKPS